MFDYSNLLQAIYEYKNSITSYAADAAEYAEQAERWKGRWTSTLRHW